jgi:hypothetical protein
VAAFTGDRLASSFDGEEETETCVRSEVSFWKMVLGLRRNASRSEIENIIMRDQRKKRPGKRQAKTKKLQLSKETVKDLSASESKTKKAKGGLIRPPPDTDTCITCTCITCLVCPFKR